MGPTKTLSAESPLLRSGCAQVDSKLPCSHLERAALPLLNADCSPAACDHENAMQQDVQVLLSKLRFLRPAACLHKPSLPRRWHRTAGALQVPAKALAQQDTCVNGLPCSATLQSSRQVYGCLRNSTLAEQPHAPLQQGGNRMHVGNMSATPRSMSMRLLMWLQRML